MIASHGLIGAEDLIFPIIGMMTGGATVHVAAGLVDDALEGKQDVHRDKIAKKERKLLSAEIKPDEEPVGG